MKMINGAGVLCRPLADGDDRQLSGVGIYRTFGVTIGRSPRPNVAMDPLDTYAAPDAVSTDLVREASSIPRMFEATLIALVLAQMLIVIAMPTSSSIVLFGVTALATWKTLQHHRAASRLLGVFLVVDALMFYAAASGLALRHSLAAGGIMFALAICALGSVGYLFFSPTMRAVFRKTEATKWSGGGA